MVQDEKQRAPWLSVPSSPSIREQLQAQASFARGLVVLHIVFSELQRQYNGNPRSTHTQAVARDPAAMLVTFSVRPEHL